MSATRAGCWARRVQWAAALAALAACAATRLSMRPAPRAFTPDDYERVYEAWTRSADAFSLRTLRTVLHVTATFESWEFRWAYVVRYAHDMNLEPELRRELLRSTLADAQTYHRFFVTLVGERYKESDLTSPRSAWQVLLLDKRGRVTRPVRIERIKRIGALERSYFPSVSPFRQVFRIVFPAHRPDGTPTIAPDARFVLLRFTGPQGRVDLRWDFAQAP